MHRAETSQLSSVDGRSHEKKKIVVVSDDEWPSERTDDERWGKKKATGLDWDYG